MRESNKFDSERLTTVSRKLADSQDKFEQLEACFLLAEQLIQSDPRLAEDYLLLFFDLAHELTQATLVSPARLDSYTDPLTDSAMAALSKFDKSARALLPGLRESLNRPNLLSNRFVNPTGGGIRGQDAWGSGEYGAPRGNTTHAGVDYVGAAGAAVSAVIGGTLEVVTDGVRITGRVDGTLYTVRQLHIDTTVSGGRVQPGGTIATVADLTPQYPGIINHCHVEVYEQPGDVRVDPTPLIPLP